MNVTRDRMETNDIGDGVGREENNLDYNEEGNKDGNIVGRSYVKSSAPESTTNTDSINAGCNSLVEGSTDSNKANPNRESASERRRKRKYEAYLFKKSKRTEERKAKKIKLKEKRRQIITSELNKSSAPCQKALNISDNNSLTSINQISFSSSILPISSSSSNNLSINLHHNPPSSNNLISINNEQLSPSVKPITPSQEALREGEEGREEETENRVGAQSSLSRTERRKIDFLARCSSSPTVAIDCDFEKYQTEKEFSSLSQQVMFSYGKNSRSPQPLQLSLCGIPPPLLDRLNNISGFDKWTCSKHTTTCIDAYNHLPPSSLVYLTADSNVTLTTLEKDKVYIIGGIVDRNRYKSLTMDRANTWGIATAKLPIEEHYTLTGSRVLTVNQVMEILIKFNECGDWCQAIQAAFPERKGQKKGGGK